MNRPIKFRTRHTSGDKWLYFTLTDLFAGNAAGIFMELDNWCEFTGLLDKNGKEIYEGDFIRINDADYKIVWNENSCGFKLQHNGLRLSMRQAMKQEVEVVGNIYENPELIKP